jgi:hypothetical protein
MYFYRIKFILQVRMYFLFDVTLVWGQNLDYALLFLTIIYVDFLIISQSMMCE